MIWSLILGLLVKLYVNNSVRMEVNILREKKIFLFFSYLNKGLCLSKLAIGLSLSSFYLFGLFSFFFLKFYRRGVVR